VTCETPAGVVSGQKPNQKVADALAGDCPLDRWLLAGTGLSLVHPGSPGVVGEIKKQEVDPIVGS
jgi:hypothetical protein